MCPSNEEEPRAAPLTDRAPHIAALHLPLDKLPDPLPIPVIERPFDVVIRPPGSKSITNRALLLAALADGTSELRGPLIDADDSQVMLRAIQQLGAMVDIQRAPNASSGSSVSVPALDIVRITGVNGRWKIPSGETITLNLNNAGTATRFLTAAAILAPADSGGIIIDGDARMRERPIGELVDALNHLHDPEPVVEYLGRGGYLPIHVHAERIEWRAPSHISFGRTLSSQFISAMLQVGAFLPGGLKVTLPASDVTSQTYVDMTIGLMARLGMRCIRNNPEDHALVEQVRDRVSLHGSGRDRNPYQTVSIDPQCGQEHDQPRLPAFTLDIEPDASGATYFEAAATLFSNAKVTIQGLDLGPKGSLQGDTHFVAVLTAAGARVERLSKALRVSGPSAIKPIDFDLSDMPDTAMTAAVLACFASPTPENPDATSTLRGLRTLRVKETDRLAALQTELSKLGAKIEIFQDHNDEGLRITPPPPSPTSSLRHSVTPPLFFDTYNDHRMAMALALIGLRRPNVFIRNPACVAKTYPTFWQDFARLYQ